MKVTGKAKTLKQLRKDAGLTMEDVVKRLAEMDIIYSGRAAVGKWESGSTPPHQTVKALSEILAVTPEQIYEGISHAPNGRASEQVCAKKDNEIGESQ